MVRAFYLAYAALCYAIFFATFLYLIAFVGNLPVVQPTVDFAREATLGRTLLIDAALIALFGVQHSAMARPRFKAAWTRIVPAPIERSTSVLLASPQPAERRVGKRWRSAVRSVWWAVH